MLILCTGMDNVSILLEGSTNMVAPVRKFEYPCHTNQHAPSSYFTAGLLQSIVAPVCKTLGSQLWVPQFRTKNHALKPVTISGALVSRSEQPSW